VGKAIVFSILLATVGLPLFYARERRKKRGLRKAVTAFAVYCVVWVFATLYVAPHL